MTSKTARMVTGDKIKFEGEIIIPVSLNGITKKLICPVGWGCRIHRLLLCRGVRPLQRVSWI